MLYGLVGLTFAHFETDRSFIQIHEYDANGLSVGAGIEKKIGPDWSVRAEYRYTDFGKTDENWSEPLQGFSGENQFNNKMHIGRIGIARRLGRSEPSAEALK
jgi:opacity protein-like surface antigen